MQQRKKFFKHFLLVLSLCAPTVPAISVSAQSTAEYKLKAGFVLNFMKLSSLQQTDGQYSVCVVGSSLVQNAFSSLESRKINDVEVSVKELSRTSQAPGCSVIFIAHEIAAQRSFVTASRGHSILTVGEDDSFLSDGGIINFYSEGNKIRFEINLKKIKKREN